MVSLVTTLYTSVLGFPSIPISKIAYCIVQLTIYHIMTTIYRNTELVGNTLILTFPSGYSSSYNSIFIYLWVFPRYLYKAIPCYCPHLPISTLKSLSYYIPILHLKGFNFCAASLWDCILKPFPNKNLLTYPQWLLRS